MPRYFTASSITSGLFVKILRIGRGKSSAAARNAPERISPKRRAAEAAFLMSAMFFSPQYREQITTVPSETPFMIICKRNWI